MKISLNWLKEYIALSGSPEKLAERLTMAGQEVEKIHSQNGDTVFELEVTPNRPDCLNYLGIGREFSAIFDKPLKALKIKNLKMPTTKCAITIEDKSACPHYAGTIVQNISVKESPDWLKRHLTSAGMRSINNVVDITNFCLMESGQPLHAFDYNKLEGGKIIVRWAKPGETIVTLDGVERRLDSSILVIADEKRPVAIAGIMGGQGTEVSAQTKNILLESAYFDPTIIRWASRKLALSTDSSYRFERGVDKPSVSLGAQRALNFILDLAGGTLQAYTNLGTLKKVSDKKPITVSLSEVNNRLGASFTSKKSHAILSRLGCTVKTVSKDILKVTPPSFRNDLKTPVDFIEELARITGYDAMPSSLMSVKAVHAQADKKLNLKKKLRNLLLAQGFNEVISYTMTDQKSLAKTNLDVHDNLKVKNPLSQDQEIMRPHIWPSILKIISTNINHGQRDFKLFEIGKEYFESGERTVVALALSGHYVHDWQQGKREFNFYDMKGAVESILNFTLFARADFNQTENQVLKKNESAKAVVNGRSIAILGQVSDDVLNRWDIKYKNIYLAWIDFEELAEHYENVKRFYPTPEYPAITRDISIAIKQDLDFSKVRALVMRQSGEFLTDVKFLEEYTGEKIQAGYRGIVFSLTFQSSERTLREDEINGIHDRICKALVELGAIRR